MNWEAIGAAAEIVGAIAVVVSLLYLAVQVRQNTIAIKGSTHHQFLNTQTEANRAMSDDPEICELMGRADTDFSGLSPAEMTRLRLVYFNYFNQWDFAHDARGKSLLDGRTWGKINKGYTLMAKTSPGFCLTWQLIGETYDEKFKAHVDGVIDPLLTMKKNANPPNQTLNPDL